jgi:HD-GYP domain-containing protein (c-di-GMP phosphodiesterase class II)/uncharacterized protein HemY
MSKTAAEQFDLGRARSRDMFALLGNGPATQALKKGMLLRFKKEIPQAIEVLEKAHRQFVAQNSPLGQAYTLIELAWLYGTERDKATSNRMFQLTEQLIADNSAGTSRDALGMNDVKARLLHYQGLLHYGQSDYGQALKHFKLALAECDPNSLEAAKLYDSLGVHYERTGDFHRAVRYLKNALHIKRQYDDLLYEEAITCQILGRLFLIYEEYELALANLHRSLEVSTILKDEKRKAALKIELIRLYLRCGRQKEAKELIHEARQDCEHRHLHIQLALTYFYEAYLSFQHSRPEEAEQLLERRVFPVFQRHKYRKGLALAKRLSAWTQYALRPDDFQASVGLIGQSIELFRQENMIEEVAKSHFELGKLYNQSSNPTLALTSFLDALKLAEENGLFYLTPYIEDEIYRAHEPRWMEIVNKRARHQRVFEKQESLIESLSNYLHSQPAEPIQELSEATRQLVNPDNTESDNTRSLTFLLSLLRVGEAISGVREMNELMTVISRETERALSAERCTLFLYDDSKNELWSRYTSPDGCACHDIHIPAHVGVTGYVVKTGQAQNISNTKDDPRFSADVDSPPDVDTHSMLCSPMKNRSDEIIGVFQVINKLTGGKLNGGCFQRSDEELLAAISNNAGVAIENARLYDELKMTFESFIKTLSTTIDARDPITAGHSERVTEYSLLIGEIMGLSPEEMQALKYAGLLHDIGKIGVREEVLMKQGRLTVKEYAHIQEHVYYTGEILKNIRFEKHLACVPLIAASHHEKFDGSGYFRGIAGDDIPLGGRILAVADVFDAITSRRQYRSRMPFDRVINVFCDESGKHFDTNVVEAFFDVRLSAVAEVLCMDNMLENQRDEIEAAISRIPASMTMRDYIQLADFDEMSAEQQLAHESFMWLYNLTAICDMD